MEACWTRSMTSGEQLDVESRIRLKDGSYRWFRSRAAPRRDEAGRVLRWYGTDEDIHERKLAEQQVSYMALIRSQIWPIATCSADSWSKR